MANHRNRFPARRRFLKQSTALTASVVALPHLARATTAGEPATDQKTAAEPQTGRGANAPQPTLRFARPSRTRESKS